SWTVELGSPQEAGRWLTDPGMEPIALLVSLLLASGFALTDRWFRLRDRYEARFRLISEVDRSLIGVLEEDRILSIVCEVLSRRKGYRLAWIGSGEPDGSVRVVKHAGEAGELLSAVPVRWDDTPEGGGPTGLTLRTGETCVVNRAGSAPCFAPWKGIAAELGLRSAVSVRIEPNGQQPMALSIYADARSAFDRLEVEAVSALAHRIGTAIESARRYEFFVSAKRAYDDLLRAQRDGVILVRGKRIVRANPAAAALLGYNDEDELVGRDPLLILRDPESDAALARLLHFADEEAERQEWGAEIRRCDGSSFSGEVAVTWVPREDRQATFVPNYSGPLGMILLRDVTLRKKVLEDLCRERDFSAKILDIAEVLVVELTPCGEILLCNRRFEEVTGYASGEAAGKRMADLLIPETSQSSYERAFAGVLSGQGAPGIEYPLVSRTGDERLIVWNHAVMRDPAGHATSVIATGTDATESRRLEQQIIEMQKMEAVGTLAGGVAHDFNNILTGILCNLDLARKVIPPESLAAAPVQESIKASERAAHMICQLLDFSRRSPSERRPIDLRKVVHEVVHLFAQTIDKRIEVGTYVGQDLWHADADPNQMHQVLMNLCVNARDAIMECLEGKGEADTPHGAYRIQVFAGNASIGEEYCRMYPYSRPGEFVLVSISDNGSGMDEATQRRVFEPFFTTKQLGRGTGLGLSTVYGIIKQHDGWINLDSQWGKGTTFRAYLPRATERQEEKPLADETVRPKTGVETVLLVDDEEMIRDLAKQILQLHGYSVFTASDGQEAIDFYTQRMNGIDLVILDLTMPHLSGNEVLTRIRNLNPRAKIILSSGYSSGGTSLASAFLPKPYRADALVNVVREVLDR
ncbi:MAG: PAS domain S-box protein, partial [Deltaproteobacteria bacterium]|nr:PAS domain S-box protein [Deltaproteobacteria bacterium]